MGCGSGVPMKAGPHRLAAPHHAAAEVPAWPGVDHGEFLCSVIQIQVVLLASLSLLPADHIHRSAWWPAHRFRPYTPHSAHIQGTPHTGHPRAQAPPTPMPVSPAHRLRPHTCHTHAGQPRAQAPPTPTCYTYTHPPEFRVFHTSVQPSSGIPRDDW